MYAYFHAKFLLKEQKEIRVLSLGTGEPPETPKSEKEDKEQETKLATITSLANFDLMMNFESLTADAILSFVLKPGNYVRANKKMAEDY